MFLWRQLYIILEWGRASGNVNYRYKDFLFKNLDNKSILYKNGKVLFIGNSWSGILIFLDATNNAPNVYSMFKQQLETREQLKFKQQKDISK